MSEKVFGTPKQKPLAGHKCLGAKLCIEVSCECGWISCPHSGENARAAAYSEWRDHVRMHHRMIADEQKLNCTEA